MIHPITKMYLSKLKKQLPISSPAKKAFLHTLKQNIENYIIEHPDATYELVKTNFGTPDEVALSFCETINPDELNTQVYLKKKIIWGCSILIAILLLLCGWYHQKLSRSVAFYEFEEIESYIID